MLSVVRIKFILLYISGSTWFKSSMYKFLSKMSFKNGPEKFKLIEVSFTKRLAIHYPINSKYFKNFSELEVAHG